MSGRLDLPPIRATILSTARDPSMTTEQFLASSLLLTHESNRVFIGDLDSYQQEIFDKVLEETDDQTRSDFFYEGAINLHCNLGSVQIYGSNVI
jgi:hypothetical protein